MDKFNVLIRKGSVISLEGVLDDGEVVSCLAAIDTDLRFSFDFPPHHQTRPNIKSLIPLSLTIPINKKPPEKSMKVFIWHRVSQCTDSFHTEGGVVVLAETEERARQLANSKPGCNILPEEKPDKAIALLDSAEETVYIMPSFGFC